MSKEVLSELIDRAYSLLSEEDYSDISKEILKYKADEAKSILETTDDEEQIRRAIDGNSWAMLGGLKSAIDLYLQKKCKSEAERNEKNNNLKKAKAAAKRDYTSGDEYIFFGSDELEAIKKNLENPVISEEWNRIKKLADEYSVKDSENIAANYKAWRLLPFNFVAPDNTHLVRFEITLESGEVYLDKFLFEEAGSGKTEIKNHDFHGNMVFRSSDTEETFGNTGRHFAENTIKLQGRSKIETEAYYKISENKSCTLKLFIKQEKLFNEPMLITAVFYDKDKNKVGFSRYKWNMLTVIRWDYMFERSCADAIVYLLSNDTDCAAKAKNELIYMLSDMKNTGVLHFMRYGEKPFDDGYGTVHMGRAMAGVCVIYDILRKIPGFITTDEDEKIRKGVYFIADYLGQSIGGATRGLEYFPETEDKAQLLGGGNWTTDQYIGLAYFSMTFSDYPLSFVYMQNSKTVICEHLDKLTNPEGIWPESMRYHNAVLQHLIFYAIALKRYDGTDFTQNKKFRMMYEFMLNVQLPQYEYKNNEISHLIFGDDNLGTGKNYFHFNIASKLFRKTDPEFAERLLATWKKAGGYISFGGLNGWLLPFVMIDFEHEPKDTVGGLGSVVYKDFGLCVMRDKAEEEGDTHVTVVCTKNYGAHGHFDTGSFSYFYHKIPVSLDPCVVSYFENSLKWYRSSEAHSTLQFNGKNVLKSDGLRLVGDDENRIIDFESTKELDYIILTVNNAFGSGVQTRHIILDKESDYLIVYDRIKDFTGETIFNLPLSTKESKLISGGVFSKGIFDIDVYTDVLLPENPEISISKGAAAWGCLPGDFQDYVRIRAENNESFLVVICPVRSGKKKKEVRLEDNCVYIGDKKINLKIAH